MLVTEEVSDGILNRLAPGEAVTSTAMAPTFQASIHSPGVFACKPVSAVKAPYFALAAYLYEASDEDHGHAEHNRTQNQARNGDTGPVKRDCLDGRWSVLRETAPVQEVECSQAA